MLWYLQRFPPVWSSIMYYKYPKIGAVYLPWQAYPKLGRKNSFKNCYTTYKNRVKRDPKQSTTPELNTRRYFPNPSNQSCQAGMNIFLMIQKTGPEDSKGFSPGPAKYFLVLRACRPFNTKARVLYDHFSTSTGTLIFTNQTKFSAIILWFREVDTGLSPVA